MRFEASAALLLSTAALLIASPPARAEIGTLDEVPAATLLLPYFEVDPADPDGVTTVFTIRNASDGPIVAHVTLWSNLSVPVIDFDVYLTGYDSQSVDLRAAFVSGVLPTTGPNDALSPRGPLSKPHVAFPGCGSTLGSPPAYQNPALSILFRNHLEAALTGAPSVLFGACAGAPTPTMVGYATIDAVHRCSLIFPSDLGYFAPAGTGVASDRNALWGEWQLIDPGQNVALGEALVAIEASAEDPLTSTAGNRTFYGRYVSGLALDHREPLSSGWLVALDLAATVGEETELLVWRDSGTAQEPFPCWTLPTPFPLATLDSWSYDADGVGTPLPIGVAQNETQRFAAPAGSGIELDLDRGLDQQGHVTMLHRIGSLATGAAAVQADPGALDASDAAPGATLLLPYFDVDLGAPALHATVATVHNAAPEPVLAHAVLWTDLGVPTLGFDLALPGHGSREIDLATLFADGTLPASGPSPLPGCSERLPPSPLTATALDGLRAAHTGAASSLFGGRCAGFDHGDSLARGYMTVDVATSCSSALPTDPEFFGSLSFANVLWGESVSFDGPADSSHGEHLVHLQASTSDPLTGPGQRTFYGRFTAPAATDHREALPDLSGVAYSAGGPFDEQELVIWRDPGLPSEPFDCASIPAPFPLAQGVSLRFDDAGFDGLLPSPAAGLASQRTAIAQPFVPGTFGWLFLDLDTLTGGPFGTLLQSHVTGIARSFGRFSLSLPAVRLPIAHGSTVSVTATDPQAAERVEGRRGETDPGEVTVGRTGPLDQPLDLLLTVSGTATQGTDYDLLWGPVYPPPASGSPLPVTIPAGASTLAITVRPAMDLVADDGETVVVSVMALFGYTVDPPQPAIVTISEISRPPGQPPAGVIEIPTLSVWGMILLALALLGAAQARARTG